MILEVEDDDVEDDAKEKVVNDITDSNAMIPEDDDDKAKEKVVNMNEVKTIAEAKFGGPKELAEEQKKSARPQKKSKKKSKLEEKNVNAFCLEQEDKLDYETSELFGYIRNLRGINSLRQKPSIIVTESPIKTVLSSYPNLQHSKKKPTIFKNLIDALVAAPPHSTVLVDMNCDLSEMIMDCEQSKSSSVVDMYDNKICLDKNMKIVGTERGKITSDPSCFLVKTDIQLSLVDLTIENTDGGEGTSVIFNCGVVEMLRCKLFNRSSFGSALAVCGGYIASLSMCELENISKGPCVYLEDINDDTFRERISFENNTINYAGDVCFEFDGESDTVNAKFEEEIETNNTLNQIVGEMDPVCECCGNPNCGGDW